MPWLSDREPRVFHRSDAPPRGIQGPDQPLGKRGNLGRTRLVRRRAGRDPMAEYDALPRDLRRWLSTAVMPWSPRSCLKIWRRAKADGASPEQVLARLSEAEKALLAKDWFSL